MIRMEHVVFSVAVCGLLWSGVRLASGGHVTAEPSTPALPATDGVAASDDAFPSGVSTEAVAWLPPADGTDFDLFTPPPLRRDPESGAISLRAADVAGPVDGSHAGITLIGLVPEPFRLQLVGFAGEGGDWVGLFENRRDGRTFLARAPRDVPELALRIESLDVARQTTVAPNAMVLAERAAVAKVLDHQTGERLTLTSVAAQGSGRWRVRLRDRASGEEREALSGSDLLLGDTAYRIGRVVADEGVEVTRFSAASPPTLHWLRLERQNPLNP